MANRTSEHDSKQYEPQDMVGSMRTKDWHGSWPTVRTLKWVRYIVWKSNFELVSVAGTLSIQVIK
jgi:hypothetical protein